jgi:sigma-B regulation protein RsbU (phosphoserine phosphatase)
MPIIDPSLLNSQVFFDEAPCGLIVTQEDGTIFRANLAFAAWIGFSEVELCGRRFQELLTMGGRMFHQTHWAPLMKMQGSVAEVKLDLVRRDKQIITLLLNGVRREHSSGAYYELALFGISDREKYERALVDARKAAENLLQEKTEAEAALRQMQAELRKAYELSERRASFAEQMVAIVSHDLKNPLSAIMMASEMLAKDASTARQTKMLGHISESSGRAQRMIADLLDLALARVGRGIVVSPSEIDLHCCVSRCVEELRLAFPQATLIHRSFGTGKACLDTDRVQQVVGNLTANSVAYGDLTQPITITSQQDDDEAMVSVHNAGPAIPEAVIAELFEPMKRGSHVGSDMRSIGLGLFIVREIAKAHGGQVRVNSTTEHGTTFDVYFSRAQL